MTEQDADLSHRNLDADEQAFWDAIFLEEWRDGLVLLREDKMPNGHFTSAEAADHAVKQRRMRLPPKSAWEAMAKTYERALEQIRGALGLTDIDEHETVLGEIARLKNTQRVAFAQPPWQLPSDIPISTVLTQGGPT